MNYTENHHLPQWDSTDRVLRNDFNDAMTTIDTALTACGNCTVVFGTYTGNGSISQSPVLQFDSTPVALFLSGGGYSLWMLSGSGAWTFANNNGLSTPIGSKWENHSVYWWYAGNEHTAAQMMNEQDTVYKYLALLQS